MEEALKAGVENSPPEVREAGAEETMEVVKASEKVEDDSAVEMAVAMVGEAMERGHQAEPLAVDSGEAKEVAARVAAMAAAGMAVVPTGMRT